MNVGERWMRTVSQQLCSDIKRSRLAATAAFSIVAAVAVMTLGVATAVAQEGPGGLINPQRDCKTVVTCNFRRGGRYRGCLSSYSCRACRTVASNCQTGGRGRVCYRVRCGWGGV